MVQGALPSLKIYSDAGEVSCHDDRSCVSSFYDCRLIFQTAQASGHEVAQLSTELSVSRRGVVLSGQVRKFLLEKRAAKSDDPVRYDA